MVAGKGKRSFYKDGVLRFTAMLRDGTYQLDMPEAKTCAVADVKFDNLPDLWHFRLGRHCNYNDMKHVRGSFHEKVLTFPILTNCLFVQCVWLANLM